MAKCSWAVVAVAAGNASRAPPSSRNTAGNPAAKASRTSARRPSAQAFVADDVNVLVIERAPDLFIRSDVVRAASRRAEPAGWRGRVRASRVRHWHRLGRRSAGTHDDARGRTGRAARAG